ncbi:hypothetical protein J0X19_05030 [Hymenobacter sp. BT186]|uniref:Gliding motility protein GldL-like N-terminal domain-containing protein n=1 Tax=Hymenobacter telluris TaxID=2816474 RepID=A0A939ET50_9BACT|nr:hypothetical protein [Hymenobacter telluris]MBO0357299.1 hypothetical protein [Hymenobacter telluris]MBW3373325.1 hypothetical protein [Hymenobacter norwichensis]
MKLSYRLLITLLLIGMAFVLMAAFFKMQHYPGSDWLIRAGLFVQFVAGVLVVWKFANRLDKRE